MPSDVPPASDALVQALIVGGATHVGVKHPEAAVLADATGGYLSRYTEAAMQQVRDFASVFMRRRGERVTRVLSEAAERVGIGIDELATRIQGDERREQLLLRTLEAAAGTAMEAWLPLYATALANGTIADELGDVSWRQYSCGYSPTLMARTCSCWIDSPSRATSSASERVTRSSTSR